MSAILDELRRDCIGGRVDEAGADRAVVDLAATLEGRLEAFVGRSVRRVLNATGVFVHTNLGRSPLPREVAEQLPGLLDAYCDLEVDAAGGRGDRNRRCDGLLRSLTGAEAGLVVNNNAAALVLVLATLAKDREVVVSRGELVEIGGSFRVPAILEAAGARLVEVGSTNRTRLDDYEQAIGADTALLLRVFPSNYRQSGFVASVDSASLVALSERTGVPLLVDEGSGLLQPSEHPQLNEHPSLRELMEQGVSLACGSGDKVLGGPQAGLLVGHQDLVAACHRHPLYRALRPDRACLAALEAVLRLRLAGSGSPVEALWQSSVVLTPRLKRLAEAVGGEIVPSEAFVGGGAAPEAAIPGEAVALPENDDLRDRLRLGDPSVVAFIKAGQLIFDLRTVDPLDDAALIDAVRHAQAK